MQAWHYRGIEHPAEAQHDAAFSLIYYVEAHEAPDYRCNCSHANQQAGRHATCTGPTTAAGIATATATGLTEQAIDFLAQVFDDFIDVRWPLVTTATATTTPWVVVFTVITRFIPSHWFLHSFIKLKNRF